MQEKMFGLTDGENTEYLKLAALGSRTSSLTVKMSCDARCNQLQEKSYKYIQSWCMIEL